MASQHASMLIKTFSFSSTGTPFRRVRGVRNVFRSTSIRQTPCASAFFSFSSTRLCHFSKRPLTTPVSADALPPASLALSCLPTAEDTALPRRTGETSEALSPREGKRRMTSGGVSSGGRKFGMCPSSPFLRSQRRRGPCTDLSSSLLSTTCLPRSLLSIQWSVRTPEERSDNVVTPYDGEGRRSFSPPAKLSSLQLTPFLHSPGCHNRQYPPSTSFSLFAGSFRSFASSRYLPLSLPPLTPRRSTSSSSLSALPFCYSFFSPSSLPLSRADFLLLLPPSFSCQKSFFSSFSDKEKDLYEILGVSENASQDEIKKAYRQLALKWHPDRNPTNREIAEEKFRSVSDAYQTLSNSERRSEYDALRKFGARTAGAARGGPGGSAFSSEGFFREGSNPFSSAFGGAGAGGSAFRHHHRMSQEEAERLFAQVFGGLSLQDILGQLLRDERGVGGGGRSGAFSRTASEGEARGQGGGGGDFFESSIFSGRHDGAGGGGRGARTVPLSSSRVVNVIHRDGRMFEKTVLTQHYPGGRVERQVMEREIPQSTHANTNASASQRSSPPGNPHPFHGFSPFDSFFGPPRSSSSSSSPFSNRGVDLERLMRDAFFPQSPASHSQSSSTPPKKSSPSPSSSSSSSSAQKSFGGSREEAKAEKQSPQGFLADLFARDKKIVASPLSSGSALRSAVWNELKHAVKGAAEIFVLNIKLWLMNKAMSFLSRLIQSLLRRK